MITKKMADEGAFLTLLIAGFKPAGKLITKQEVSELMSIFLQKFPSFSLNDVVALKSQLYKECQKKPNWDLSQEICEMQKMVNMLGDFERLLKESIKSKLVMHL